MSFKSLLAGLGLALGMNVGFAFAGDARTAPAPQRQVRTPADLAAAEIASSLSSFDPEGNSAPKYVTFGVIRNVGGTVAPAGRTATLQAFLKLWDHQSQTHKWQWKTVAFLKLPAIAPGQSVQISTDVSNAADYRLTISGGDSHPANDTLLMSSQPKPKGI